MGDKNINSLNDKTSHKNLFKVIKDLSIQLVSHKNFIDKLECLCNENNIVQCIVAENKLNETNRICSEILEKYRVHMEELHESISSMNSYFDTGKFVDAETIRDVKKHYQEIVIQRKILFLTLKQVHAKPILKYKKIILEQDIKNYEKINYELHNFS